MQQAEMEVQRPVEQGGPVDGSVDSVEEEVLEADASAASEGEDDEEGEGVTAEDGQEPRKPYSKLKERMHQLSEEAKREKLRAEQADQELKRMQDEIARMRSFNPLGQHMQQKPKLEDFDYDAGQYEQALSQWMQQGNQIQQQAYAQAQQQIQQQAKLQATRVTGVQKYPDFDQVVNNPNVPSLAQIAPAAYQALISSDASADVAYALAKDPAKVWNMRQMDPLSQARMIWQIEQEVKAAPQPRPPQTDPATVPSGGMGPATKDPDKMTMKEWQAWRKKTLAQRNRG